MKRFALHLMALLSFTLAVALLAPRPAAADDDDPPGRVARLGFIQGTVSFEPAGTEDWVSAAVNRPLTTGDKLWNDNDSLSELNMGSATIRLGSNTGFSFLNLTDNMAQIQLTEGTLNIRILRLDDDETFEVDTPNLAFTLLRPGELQGQRQRSRRCHCSSRPCWPGRSHRRWLRLHHPSSRSRHFHWHRPNRR